MLSRFKLIHILLVGFGLLITSSLYIANLSYSSTATLKNTLDYLTEDIWGTADGAMEVTIGVENQLLALEQYVNSDNDQLFLKKLKDAQTHEEEEFNSMVSTGQLEQEAINEVNQNRQLYRQLSKELISNYQTFIETEHQRHKQYEEFIFALDEIERLEENLVAGFADRPTLKTSWNTGLGKAWTVADSMMELRIALLNRGNHYQSLLRSKNFSKYTPLINKEWGTINEIIATLGLNKPKSYFSTLNREIILKGRYKGMSFAKMIKVATTEHKSNFDKAIKTMTTLNESYTKYKTQADILLNNVSKIQVEVEDNIDVVLNDSNTLYNDITVKILFSIIAVTLFALIISFIIIRIILANTNRAREVAKSIASGNLNNQIEQNPKTEFGALMGELDHMQSALKTSRNEMEDTLNKTKRIVDALDNSSAKVIISQPDGQVVFANKKLLRYFKKNQSTFASKVKNLSDHDIHAPEIHLFRDLAITLDHDHLHELHIDERTLEVNVQAIKTEHDEIIGFFTEWNDVTETLAIQKDVKHLIDHASKGNLSDRLHTEGLHGFLLELSEGINTMMANIQNAMHEFIDVATKLSHGDFSISVDTEVEGDLKELKDALNKEIQNVSSTLGDILNTSQVVKASANNITSSSSEVSDQVSNNAASIEQIAASLEQITASVQQSSEYTSQVNNSSHKTMSHAESNAKIVHESVEAMNSIKEVSVKIDGITNLIDAIAFQTNLLALNAAVEAARAGDHGRGFAVVAGEVRSLAQKSADAAKDIKSLVIEVNEKVNQGSLLVKSSSEGLDTMISEIKSVAEMITEVSRSSIEQESGISQINSAVTNFDSATQQSAAMIGESATTSQELLKLMTELEQKLQKFKLSTAQNLISK